MDVKGLAGKVLDGNEEPVFGKWRKGNPCCIMTEHLAELWPEIVWKRKLIGDEFGDSAEDISKKNVEDITLFLLTAYSKTQEEGDG